MRAIGLAAVVVTGFVAALCAPGMTTASWAQGTRVPFGNTKHDATAPVEITSDRLDLDQAKGTALFSGTVKVAQGEMRLAADQIEVFYSDQSQGGQNAGGQAAGSESTGKGNQVDRMIATGNVTLSNGTEAAESQSATYEVGSGIITMQGKVLLTQGPNALSSERMRIDLNAGTGELEGRVQTIFVPGTKP